MNKGQIRKIVFNVIIPPILVIILFAVAIGSIIIPATENALMEKKKETISAIVKSANSIIEKHIEIADEGSVAIEESKKAALDEMRALRYGDENNDYLWIIDLKPNMVMHPYFPELEGKSLSDYYDKDGKLFFVEAIDIAKKSKSGYINYSWPKGDNLKKPIPKLSYIQLVDQWEWVVGSGIYLDDVHNEIKDVTLRITIISSIIGVNVLLLLILMIYRGLENEKKRRIAEKEVEKTSNAYKALAQTSGEMIFLTENHKITAVNNKACKILGFDEKEIVGDDIENLADTNLGKQVIEQIKSGENIFATEIYLAGKEGNIKTVIYAEHTEVNENKAILYTGFQVVEEKESNDNILSNKLINKSGIGVLVLKGMYNSKVIKSDDVVSKILEQDKIIGENLIDIFNNEDANRFMTELSINNKVDNMILRGGNNSNNFFSLWGSIIDDSKELKGKIIVLVNDITNGTSINRASSEVIKESLLPKINTMKNEGEIDTAMPISKMVSNFNKNKIILMNSVGIGIKPISFFEKSKLSIQELFNFAVMKSFEELGFPPCKFSLIGLGSLGRQEATLLVDQDTAIIFENTDNNETNEKYFYKLGKSITKICEKAGIPICDGENTACFEKWCMNESKWKGTFGDWIKTSTPQDLLNINIFFDFKTMYGEKKFAIELRQYVMKVIENYPNFTYNLAQNIMSYVLPSGFMGRLKSDSKKGNYLNLKGVLMHYVNFARIYSVKNFIHETSTTMRLEAIKEKQILSDELIDKTIDSYKFLMELRLKNQVKAIEMNFKEENTVILDNLSEWDKTLMKKATSQVQNIQRRVGSDFVPQGWS